MSDAFGQSKIFRALRTIRQSATFSPPTAFRPVTVAIIDTGLSNPASDSVARDEFTDNGVERFEFFDAVLPVTDPTTHTFQRDTPFDAYGHGTSVASVYAALNNNKGSMNGIFYGLLQPNESLGAVPFRVLIYNVNDVTSQRDVNLSTTAIHVALHDIRTRGRVDVVNMSFAKIHPGYGPELTADKDAYRALMQPMVSTLFVIAAGNSGVDAGVMTPSALAADLDNVMSVGGVAVDDLDGTGEGSDARAIFATPPQLARQR